MSRHMGIGLDGLCRETPPSVLPDISPSRGEIRRGTVSQLSSALNSVYDTGLRQCECPHPISPLEGEMPGRAEGGGQGGRMLHSSGHAASSFTTTSENVRG